MRYSKLSFRAMQTSRRCVGCTFRPAACRVRVDRVSAVVFV